MQFEENQIQLLDNTIQAAKALGIESVKFSDSIITGLNPSQTCIICHPTDAFAESQMGISRFNVLKPKLASFMDSENFKMEGSLKGDFVSALTLKRKGSKVTHKTSDPDAVRGPSNVRDVMSYAFEITLEDIKTIINAQSFIENKTDDKDGVICIMGNNDTVDYEIIDKHDSFTGTFDTVALSTQGEEEFSFSFRYPLKPLMAALNKQPGLIQIGKQGFLKSQFRGITTYVLPRVN